MAKFNRGLFIAYANDNQDSITLEYLLKAMGITNAAFVIKHYRQPMRGTHRLQNFGESLYTALFHLPHYKEIVNIEGINFNVEVVE